MDDATTQLRAIIDDETLPITDRKTAASHIVALRASGVDMDIPADDPGYVRLTADHIDMDGGIWQFKIEPMTHDEAVAEVRNRRLRAAHGAAAADMGLHRLERLSNVAALLELLPVDHHFRINAHSPDRLLTNLDKTGSLSGGVL